MSKKNIKRLDKKSSSKSYASAPAKKSGNGLKTRGREFPEFFSSYFVKNRELFPGSFV